ncbi:MAG: hypothetical protein R3362_06070 [Rhodothermales bacterium]|nr:hypothetical protein [Rhodothermales bacterium]
MAYLVVTHLSDTHAHGTEGERVEEELAALGLLSCLVDSRDEAHVLPPGTYAGVVEGPTAQATLRQFTQAVREVVGRARPGTRVLVSVGGHSGLRTAA